MRRRSKTGEDHRFAGFALLLVAIFFMVATFVAETEMKTSERLSVKTQDQLWEVDCSFGVVEYISPTRISFAEEVQLCATAGLSLAIGEI